jgi:hypothetical protein
MLWCAKCGVEISGGLLLCERCVPKGKLRQSATIELISPPNMKFDPSGKLVQSTPGYGKSTVKASDMSAGSTRHSPLRTVQKIQWNHDRQRNERAVWLYDRDDNVYCETWFDLDTGEITWGPKTGPLDDQAIHGPSEGKP